MNSRKVSDLNSQEKELLRVFALDTNNYVPASLFECKDIAICWDIVLKWKYNKEDK